jgi:hypothetical protein
VFSWDYLTDEGPSANTNVSVRIRADDGQGFGSWFTLNSQAIGNDGPIIDNTSTAGGGGNVVLVTFEFKDANSDSGGIAVAYSIDQGANWIDVTIGEFIGNPPFNLASSPGGTPGQFIWDSSIALPDYVGDVHLLMYPFDQPSGFSMATVGTPVVIGPEPVDNSVNGPPVADFATTLDALTFTGEVHVDFDLLDDESDASLLHVEYTEDDVNWFDATLEGQVAAGLVGPFFTSPSPSLYSFIWDALADIGDSASHTVKLRLTGNDGQSGVSEASDWFTIVGNSAPDVTWIDVFQNSGNITVNFEVEDENFDPVSLALEYSTDGGTNFNAVPSSDWIFGNPASVVSSPIGENNVMIWDSLSTLGINNYAGVILRATPTDTPQSAPTATLTGAAFDSDPFPVVNDAAGADPVDIDIFTSGDGTSTTTPPPPDATNKITVPLGGTIGLGSDVVPASATERDTLWEIWDGAGYGTLSKHDGSAGNPAFATGSITVADYSQFVDGDTFTIDDGLYGPRTFEFDNNSSIGLTNAVITIPFTDNNDAASAIAAAVTSHMQVLISCTSTLAVINMTHDVACDVGNNTGSSVPEANATPISISTTGTPFGAVVDLDGGTGDEFVKYTAPAVAPIGATTVTLRCSIDNPGFVNSVFKEYVLHFGDAPTSVVVSPPTASVILTEQLALSAVVNPGTAPQGIDWEVVGGAVNGTIDQTGLFTAPSVMPGASSIVIRAISIDDTVFGTAVITLVPEPTSVVVTPTTTNIIEIDVGNQTEQFNSTVNPAAAPQTVNWIIFWDGNNMGSGNLATVGTVSATGLYTSPNTQPVPDIINVVAVSTVRPAVFGSYQLKLKALVPTGFVLTPATATLTAGGAGQQFSVSNFVPVGANESVTWSINPPIGSVSGSGFYTPPGTLGTQTIVTLRAESAIAPTVFQTSVITVDPNTVTAPVSISVTPTSGKTFSDGEIIQFSHTVNPGGASQSVNWLILSGSGAITGSGQYTPAATSVDDTVIVRCESTVDTGVFTDVTITVDGNGRSRSNKSHDEMVRSDHSGLHYYNSGSATEEIWYVGGKSAVTGAEFSTEVRMWDVSSSSWHDVTSLGNGLLTNPITNISACIDDFGVIRTVVGFGNTSASEVWTYNTVSGGLTGTWVKINSSGPMLTNQSRYSLIVHPSAGPGAGSQFVPTHMMLIKDKNRVIPFHVSTTTWLAEEFTKSPSNAPGDLSSLGEIYAKDATTPQVWFAGSANGTAGAPNGVWRMNVVDMSPNPPEMQWAVHTSSGHPSRGVKNAALAWDRINGRIVLYGGQDAQTMGYPVAFWEISITTAPPTASWARRVPSFLNTPTPTPPELAYPQSRSHADITMGVFADVVYLYGGENGQGKFGDVWTFDYPGSFTPDTVQTTGILPAGRESPAAALDNNGDIWVYGGLTSSGPSDELWVLKSYDPNSGTGDWELEYAEAPVLGHKPPPLWGASFEYDINNNVFWLFGGATNNPMSNYNSDVYEYNPTNREWTKHVLSGGPGALAGMATYYAETQDAIACFGGSNSGGTSRKDSFFSLDVSSIPPVWTPMTSTGSKPSPRDYATLGYDSAKDFIYLIGGDDGAGGQRQLFQWASGNWTQLSILDGSSAEDVSRSGAVWDETNLRFFNAPATHKDYQSVTLTTNGPSWHYLISPSTNNTTGSVGIFDSAQGYYICLFGRKSVKGSQTGTNVTRSFMVQ